MIELAAFALIFITASLLHRRAPASHGPQAPEAGRASRCLAASGLAVLGVALLWLRLDHAAEVILVAATMLAVAVSVVPILHAFVPRARLLSLVGSGLVVLSSGLLEALGA